MGNEKDPGSAYMFDISKGSLSLISSYAPWLKDYKLATTEPFTYTARDGLKLHGYITLPVDYKEGTKIPFILHPHGGPNARDYLVIIQRFSFMLQEDMELFNLTIEDLLVMEDLK